MKQNVGELISLGGNVYQDKHNRQIIFDKKTNKFYLIEKEDERKLNLLTQRPILAITALLLIGFLANNWIIAVVVGVIIFGVGEYYYRKKFIPNLAEVSATLPIKESKVEEYAKQSFGKNVGRIVCGILLPILLAINDYITITQKGYDGINTIALIIMSIAFAVYAIYIVVVSIKAIALQKGNKE